MKSKILAVVLLSLLVACNKTRSTKKPDNLISEKEMVHLLIDMNLFVSAKGSNKKHIEELGINPKDYIYRKYNIDSLQFAASNDYYTRNSEIYKRIYSKVQDSLKVLGDHLKEKDELERQEIKQQDSIRKSKGIVINDSIIPTIKPIIEKQNPPKHLLDSLDN